MKRERWAEDNTQVGPGISYFEKTQIAWCSVANSHKTFQKITIHDEYNRSLKSKRHHTMFLKFHDFKSRNKLTASKIIVGTLEVDTIFKLSIS